MFVIGMFADSKAGLARIAASSVALTSELAAVSPDARVAHGIAEEERVALTDRIADLLGQTRVGVGQRNDFEPLLDGSAGSSR